MNVIINSGISAKITENLKERFCKDMNLPIKIFCEPYFSERLKLLDRQFNCIGKYNAFIKEVEFFGGEQNYLTEYNAVKDRAINFLKENSAMKEFSERKDFSCFSITKDFPSHDIYKSIFDNCCFVSFDMKKANFTALRHYDESIVRYADTYEDFISNFTSSEHMISSKYIRQVIFGNVSVKRQVTYEKYLMSKVLEKVLRKFNSEDIVYFGTDEIVAKINISEKDNLKIFADNIISECHNEKIEIRYEFFMLHKINGCEGFIKKDLFSDIFSLKGVSALYMPSVLRTIYQEKIKDDDLVFIYDGQLAKLLKEPDIVLSDIFLV